MKTIKVLVAVFFVALVVFALSSQSFGYPPFLVKAKKFGARDCTFCHVDPEGGPPWNDRGKWLINEKERRRAETVDVEWLADYKPGNTDQTQSSSPKPPDKDDKKAALPAKTGKVDPKTFDDFVGEYELPIGIIDITREGDRLFGQPQGDTKEELIPQDDGTFSVTNVNAKVRFVRDDKGKVIEMVVNLNDQEMRGKKTK